MIQCIANIQCDGSGRVTEIYLDSRGLIGKIAPEIGNLTYLQILSFYNNTMIGIIPSSIGQLTSLTKLFLSYNQLSGRIPSSFGQLKSLSILDFNNNQLSGSIPKSVGRLSNLRYLGIKVNYFTGPIIQYNGFPTCGAMHTNCLFGSNRPSDCSYSQQRSLSECLSFCNATQKRGPCGGNGVCSTSANGKSACTCNRGYTDKVKKFTCKSRSLAPSPLPPCRPTPSPRRPPPPRRSPPPHPRPSPPPCALSPRLL